LDKLREAMMRHDKIPLGIEILGYVIIIIGTLGLLVTCFGKTG